jgi:hypothetical protein
LAVPKRYPCGDPLGEGDDGRGLSQAPEILDDRVHRILSCVSRILGISHHAPCGAENERGKPLQQCPHGVSLALLGRAHPIREVAAPRGMVGHGAASKQVGRGLGE